jgi:pseudaminic acid synthase
MAIFNNQIAINDCVIGDGNPAFIIAEMSANHGQDINKAIEIIYAAKESGADAVKLQTYTADTLTLNHKSADFYIYKGPWKGRYMYDLYKSAYTPWEWHAELQDVAKKNGISLFSSPFDSTAVDFLNDLDIPAYKIASPEIIDLPLIRKVAQTNKPIIMSTGSATLGQINEAIECAKNEGAKDIILLKCTSEYPALPEDINLKTIEDMRNRFNCIVGLSDHTMGIGVPVASIAFGAKVIEKHFVIDRNDNTADSFFSATPEEFKLLVESIRMAEKSIGSVNYPQIEQPTKRCLIVISDIKKGGSISKFNIKSLRPGGGIEPKYYNQIINNHKATKNIKKGTLLQWDLIEKIN